MSILGVVLRNCGGEWFKLFIFEYLIEHMYCRKEEKNRD